MELYFMASGVKHELDLFQTHLQTMPFLLPYKEGGKDFQKPVFGNLAPIQLFKFVFPKEYLHSVVKTLKLDENRYPAFNAQSFFLRKIMNAKKIPKPKPETKPKFFPENLNIALIPIGYKEDTIIKYDGIEHEAI